MSKSKNSVISKTTSTFVRHDQTGLASLIIAILIVVVITTLVLGFMQIIRHEQRRTLDNQLSSQAYYAAETGINDAKTAIKKGFTANKTNCGPYATSTQWPNTNKLTIDGNVQYSCLLVDQAPNSLEYTGMPINTSYVFPISTVANSLKTVNFSWSSSSAPGFRSPANKLFTPFDSWNALGLLRVDIMPVPSLDAATLISNAKTYFLYPQNGGGGSTFPFSTVSGKIISGTCSPGKAKCSVKLDGLPGGLIYARISAMYAPIDVSITGKDISSSTIQFQGVQAVIDSTGKAADVLRRVQVRVPSSSVDYPQNVITSMESFCKKFDVLSTGTLMPTDTDSACDPN